jgi:hypothetical protein
MKTITSKIIALALVIGGLIYSQSVRAACNSVPAGMNTSSITTTSAVLTWNTISGVLGYNVQYKLASSGTWSSSIPVTSATYTLTGLTAASAYNWRVQTRCTSSQTSNWTSSQSFTTLIQCVVPSGLNANSITSVGATLNWTAVSGAQGYNIQYRIVGAPSWTSTTSTSNSKTLTSLTGSTNYEWQVQTDCGSSNLSSFSSLSTFTTLIQCNVPTGLNTVNISTTSATLKWLAVSGAQGYNVQYRAAGAPSWTSASTSLTSYALSSLNASAGYEWKVQTNCGSSNTSAYSSVITFTTAATCVVPTGLTTSGITLNGATLGWNAVSGAQSYNVQYREVGSASWSNQSAVTNSSSVSSLNSSANYEWQVQTVCSNLNSSGFSSLSTFSTLTPTVTCNAPAGLGATAVTSSNATLNWTAVTGAQGYKVEYREVGASSWTSVTTPSATQSVSWLAASTNYEFHVQTLCGNSVSSAFSSIATFTTTAITVPVPTCNTPVMLSVTEITGSTATLQWMSTGDITKQFIVQYRQVGAGSWTEVNSFITSINIASLEPATNYEWQVQTQCGTQTTSGFSALGTFSTISVPVCGSVPTNLTLTGLTSSTATLSWSGVSNIAIVSGFDVRYRELNTSTWSVVNSILPSATINSLQPTAIYEWQVRTNCGGAGLSAYSSSDIFSMQGHVPVNTNQYFDANNVPNPQNPATWSTIFVSSGDLNTDAQIVHDWLLSHGCIKE